MTVTLSHAPAPGQDILLRFTTAGTATWWTDYRAIAPTTVPAGVTYSFAQAVTQIQFRSTLTTPSATQATFTLRATDDTNFSELTETVEFGIAEALSLNAGTWTDSVADFDIINNPTPQVNLSVSDSGAASEGGSALSITATRSSANASGAALLIPIQVKTADTTAQSGDYTVAASISIANNATTGTASFTVTNDSTDEPPETVVVELGTLPAGTAAGSDREVTITIADNDPTIVSLARTGSGAITEGGTVEFTVTLGRQLIAGEIIGVPLSIGGTNVTLDDWSLALATSGNTGVTLTNQTTATPQLRLSGAGAQIANLILTAATDNTDEGSGSEIYTIALGADGLGTNGFDRVGLGTTAGGGADPHGTANTFDVQVDDTTAGITVTETGSATTLTESGADTYTVVLDSQPGADVAIVPTSGTISAATVSPARLTFTSINWSATQTITVSGVNDSTDAADRAVTITHAATSTDANYNAIIPTPVMATVTDDDATAVTLAGTVGNLTEGGTKTITVTLGRRLVRGEELPVPLTFGGAAMRGTDYTLTGTAAPGIVYAIPVSGNGTVTFTGPSATVATLTLTATPDSLNETGGEIVDIDLGTLGTTSGTGLGGGASGTDNLADFTIEDPPTITITSGPAITEGSAVTFTVTASRVPSSDLMIDLTIADAAAGDYLDSGDEGADRVTLSGTTTATVTIPTQTDSTDEATGFITVTVADGTGYTVGTPPSATVRISDDDATTVTLAGTAGNLNEGTTRNLTVTLNRTLITGESLAVPLTLGGDAIRGTDYSLTGTPANGIMYTIPDSGTAGTVTFTGPAPAIATLALAVQADNTADPGETITIGLGTPVGTGLDGGTRSTGSLAFTIMEQPAIVLPLTLTVDEGSSAGYPVSLATAPTANVTVTVTGHAGTDLTLNPNSLEFTATNWNMIQTFTVTAATDADAADDTVSLTHTASGSAADYDGSITGAVTVTIADADTADVTISETAITIAEGDEGTYTVVLATQPASGVEITVTSDTTSAATVSPMILTF